MDYSKYYLKNYIKRQSAIEREYGSEPTDVSEEEYRIEHNVEIEVTPQLTGAVQTDYQYYEEDDAIIDIIPQSYDRYGSRRKGWLMSLTIITCVLLTIVIGDFVTGGALLASVGKRSAATSAPQANYYAIVLKTCDSYSVARMYAEQQRLMGGAGYILKEQDKYALVGDIYDDMSDANAAVENNEGSRLISIEIKEADFDGIFKDSSQLMQSMGGYYAAIVTQLAVIANELTGGQIDKYKALERIEGIKENLQMQYDELCAENSENKNAQLLLGDINATLGILSNLQNPNISRPNLVCDVRYSKMQIVLNYRSLVSTMSS